MPTSTSLSAIALLLCLCASIFNIGQCNTNISCNVTDQQALLAFKKGVIDPSGFLSSWSSMKDCCQWHGIHCDNITGRVQRLHLPCPYHDYYGGYYDKSKCMAGEINLPLSHLEFLRSINLKGNDFKGMSFFSVHAYPNLGRGDLPHYPFRNLSSLQYLDLSYNDGLDLDKFMWISHLPSLEHLDLSGIDLHMETEWIQLMTKLPSLSFLKLDGCKLSNISPLPPLINFSSIQYLDLSHNQFASEIIKWVSNLSDSLSVLVLEGNRLQGQIPNTILNLRNLTSLVLSHNYLSGTIPDWLGQYQYLMELDLYENSFSGPIPAALGNISSLISIDLSYNHLNGSLPRSLGKLSNLEEFLVGGNSLAGVISEMNFDKLSNLMTIDFSSSSFIFKFDSKWAPPTELMYIDLHDSKLGSTFPTWLYSLPSLHYLNISNSGISFVDHDKLWKLAMRIQVLDLSNNLIAGDISNILLNSSWIELSNNNFTGGLPRLSPSVIIFNIKNNFFSGSTDGLLCHPMKKKNKLRYLDMSQNFLSGKLPDCYTNWIALVYMNLDSNKLTGKIPDSLASLHSLQSLHLNKNRFFGDFPASVMQGCKRLSVLDVGENEFSGKIPTSIGKNIRAMILRSNQFIGNIPVEICQLSSLVILDLADNKLSGAIPKCLHNITSMVSANAVDVHEFDIFPGDSSFGAYTADTLLLVTKGQQLSYSRNLKWLHMIDLSCNNLSGAISTELFTLTSLQSLNLSQNHLTGEISEEVKNMKALESLDLSMNRLSGRIPDSMSELSFLNHLNLSYNNFTGKIPLGTQLQSFDALSYTGNPGLCGAPLQKNCTRSEEPDKPFGDDEDELDMLSCFYIGMGIGFAVGFWGVCVALFFNKKFRHVYFRFLANMKDRIYVFVVLKMKSRR